MEISRTVLTNYLNSNDLNPIFLNGDVVDILREFPDESIDTCITSPPYWQKREYNNGTIGLESRYQEYIEKLLVVSREIKRILKRQGSFWLNIGDSYKDKNLLGIPWRVAIRMIDDQGWILRNSIIWNKVKGNPDNTKDRLRTIHEDIFHFVKEKKGYYYNVDAIRSNPQKTKIVNGTIISATGVSGIRYKRQIDLSTVLNDEEKKNAYSSLEKMLKEISSGNLSDFRMVIKGQHRITHSDSTLLSGRAKEIQEKGFYFLKYHSKGSKPNDVWEIIPEDTQNRKIHFAPFPEDLCKIPIIATCPEGGIVLDPFCGTGTVQFVARNLKKKSIGIDISKEYIKIAEERCL
jgi:DNA modification methylase